MAQDLGKISAIRLKIMLPFLSTQALFDAGVGLHQLMIKYQKIHNKHVDRLQNDLVRKASIVEEELRERCVRKKITEKRKRGIKMDNYEKIKQYSHFRKWYQKYIESETKKIFYVKKK